MGSAGLPEAGRTPKAQAAPGTNHGAAVARPQEWRWAFFAAAAAYVAWLAALAAAAIAHRFS
jgi:hypothetical protein